MAALILIIALAAGAETRPLRAGWNAVALGCQRVESVGGTGVEVVAAFDGQSYALGPPSPETFNAGDGGRRGFWVLAGGPATLEYTPAEDGRGNFVEVRPGWNFVSFPGGAAALNATAGQQPVALGSVVLPLFTEVQPDNSFRSVEGPVRGDRAYWVFASAAARLTWSPPSAPAGLASASRFPGALVATAPSPRVVAAGDFDGDGNGDLAAVGARNQVSVRLATGAETRFVLPRTPLDLAAADLDGDGRAELITADPEEGSLSVVRSQGGGNFAPAVALRVGVKPRGLTVADLNGDGRLDLVSANQDSHDLSVLLATGLGTFASAVAYKTMRPIFPDDTNEPVAVASGDFNGDGRPDLAAAIVGGTDGRNGVAILLASGSPGTFEAARVYRTPESVYSLALGDFNADRRLDVATVDHRSLSLQLGDGSGALSSPQPVDLPEPVSQVQAGDYNEDGTPDLVAVSNLENCAFLLQSHGSGGFAQPLRFEVGKSPADAAVADVNSDGHLDLVLANTGATTLTLFLTRRAPAEFGLRSFGLPAAPGRMLAADFNQDGRDDLAVADAGGVSVLLEADRLGSGPPTRYFVGGSEARLAVADWNGDNRPDLAVTTPTFTDLLFSGGSPGTLRMALRLATTAVTSPFAGDFNGDGRTDLGLGHQTNRFLIYLASGSPGEFANPVTVNLSGLVGVSDFNGDGRSDLACLQLRGAGLYLADGTAGLFKPFVRLMDTDINTRGGMVADVNRDGRPDVTVVGDQLFTALSAGLSGNYTAYTHPLAGLSTAIFGGPLPAADYNQDQRPDLALTLDDTFQLLLAEGAPGSYATPLSWVGGEAAARGDFNGDGKPDLAFGTGSRVVVLLHASGN